MDNFADFDAHFCRFTSALDTSLNAAMQERNSDDNNLSNITKINQHTTTSNNDISLYFDFNTDSAFGNFDAKNYSDCNNSNNSNNSNSNMNRKCMSTTIKGTLIKPTTEYDSNANVEKSLAPGAEIRHKGVIGDHLQSNHSELRTENEDIIMDNDNIDDIINDTTMSATSLIACGIASTSSSHANDSDDDQDTIVNFLKKDNKQNNDNNDNNDDDDDDDDDADDDDDEDDIDDDEGMWTRPFGRYHTDDTNTITNGPIILYQQSNENEATTSVQINNTNDTIQNNDTSKSIEVKLNNNNAASEEDDGEKKSQVEDTQEEKEEVKLNENTSNVAESSPESSIIKSAKLVIDK